MSTEQEQIWGSDGTYGRVVERLKRVEPEMLQRMEAAIEYGAPTHTVAWIAVQFVLNGHAGEREEET